MKNLTPKEIVMNELDSLYKVQSSDLEMFTKLDENDNLIVDELGICMGRCRRMMRAFDILFDMFGGSELQAMTFIETALDWIIIQKAALKPTESGIIEYGALVAMTVHLKDKFDSITD